MLLRYGDEVRSGERALKAGLAPGAAGSGGAGGWVPFWAAGAAWVAGVDIFAAAAGSRRRRAVVVLSGGKSAWIRRSAQVADFSAARRPRSDEHPAGRSRVD